jgi:hypothetical protein
MDDDFRHQLADAIEALAKAVRDQTKLLEILVESIPATKEAELLGVSEKTVRNHRKARKLSRLEQSWW